jgi:hypothetical protein
MMNHGARIPLVLGVARFMAGCTDGSQRQQHRESALAKELAGTWDITFHLERPPSLVTDTLTVKRDISGSLAFLANRSLENHYPGVDALTNYGTYDIDFTAFGFDPRDGGRVPTVVVGSIAKDSIEMVLSPDQGGISVRMRGGIGGDSISGKWEVSFPRAGAGGGSFFMTPRRTRKF